MSSSDEVARPPYWDEIRTLLLAAMVFFVWTIGIGILNGTDLVDFDQRRILGHVHGGTLGWLTLAVYASSLWLFGGDDSSDRERTYIRVVVGFSIISFGLYLVAFSTTYGGFRPVMGSLSTLVIVAMLGWIVFRSRRVTLGVPHLGFLAANATSVVGGVLGVLWAIQISTGDQYLPTGGEGAHPAVMVVGFLFPVAILLEIVGVVIFLFRMWPSFLGVSFTAATPGRWAVVSAVGSVFVIGLAQYLVVEYEGDFDLVPAGQLLALDHAQFIASMTSAVFAMLVAATAGRTDRRLQDLTFLLVSGGVAVFVIGLLADATALKRIGAPVMGVGLLIGLAAFAAALVADGRRHSSARLEAQP